MIDYENHGIEPERLSAVLSGLRRLQTNLARLLGAANDRLLIKYLDSGSDVRIGAKASSSVATSRA